MNLAQLVAFTPSFDLLLLPGSIKYCERAISVSFDPMSDFVLLLSPDYSVKQAFGLIRGKQ